LKRTAVSFVIVSIKVPNDQVGSVKHDLLTGLIEADWALAGFVERVLSYVDYAKVSQSFGTRVVGTVSSEQDQFAFGSGIDSL
jgi:hypothetical protein